MDKYQISEKIEVLRQNIREIYSDGAPFIRYSAIKLEEEIGTIIIDYINKNFANTINNVTENDINDLIGFYCDDEKLKCQNYTKTEELIEFDIICIKSCNNFMSDEYEDAIKAFEYVHMDVEYLTNNMVKYHFKIGDNWELIFD